jgi:hypothetical protein
VPSDIKVAYGTESAVTITLASLASSSSKLAGRESAAISNTTGLYADILISGLVTTGTTPTDVKSIEVHAVSIQQGSAWPDVFDGTDSAETITSVGIKNVLCRQLAYIATDSTSDRPYPWGQVSLAARFGGVLPKQVVIFITHDTGVDLNSTGGNHGLWITPVYWTSS